MKKIILIGSGGAGKSTLAREMGKKLQIEVFHLDQLMWKPNWELVTRPEQIHIQKELVQKDAWIIDGNYGGTMDIRFQAADTIIFLDYPRTLCLYRAIKRTFQYKNKTRPDMREGCNERLDPTFLKWIWRFPKDKRPDLLTKLDELAPIKNIVIINSPQKARKCIQQL